MFKKFLLGSVCLFASGTFAHASTITVDTFNLNTSVALGNNQAGTITLTQDSSKSGVIAVTVTLNSNYSFLSVGDALAFKLNTVTGVTASNVTSGFTFEGLGSYTESPYGTFNYAVDCTGCSSNPIQNSSSDIQTLSFDLSAQGLSLLNFGNNGFTRFAADLQQFSPSQSGSVEVHGDPVVTTVPEPSSLVLLGSGLVGAAGFARRKFAKA